MRIIVKYECLSSAFVFVIALFGASFFWAAQWFVARNRAMGGHPYMDSSRFASKKQCFLNQSTTATVYPASDEVLLPRALMK
jgi:hypothetical protein